MTRRRNDLGEIFRRHAEAYRERYGSRTSGEQWRVFDAIAACRTATLGGHVDRCDECGHLEISYNACRNRHCPKCQTMAKAEWLAARTEELLPVGYFHFVFTVPSALYPLALRHRRTLYSILFRTSSRALLTLAADPNHLGVSAGFLSILHTWGQDLRFHPHVHCLVPGGGLSADGERWVASRERFFLPVRVVSRLFRRLFLEELEQAVEKGDVKPIPTEKQNASDALDGVITSCRNTEWVVYAKPPFGGPETVLDYLGRYTHRVAISNDRILAVGDDTVSFAWRDYKHDNAKRVATIAAVDFIRRFLTHVLPPRFQRVRYYGLFANRHRRANLVRCRRALGRRPEVEEPYKPLTWRERYEMVTGEAPDLCPVCRKGRMVRISVVSPDTPERQRSPP